MRITPSELSYSSAQGWKDIYGHANHGKQANTKEPRFYGSPSDLDNKTPGILEADDENHARMRKVFSNAFSPKAIQEQDPLFRTHVDLLVKELKIATADDSERQFDIAMWYT